MAESYGVTAGALSLTAATAKTVASAIAGSTVVARVIGASVWFDGSAAGNNAKVELVMFTTDGTGSAFTPVKMNGEAQNKAALCTAKTNYTVEPTTATVLETWAVPLNSGFPYLLPLGREWYLPSSRLIGIRVTSAVGVTTGCHANLQIEE